MVSSISLGFRYGMQYKFSVEAQIFSNKFSQTVSTQKVKILHVTSLCYDLVSSLTFSYFLERLFINNKVLHGEYNLNQCMQRIRGNPPQPAIHRI